MLLGIKYAVFLLVAEGKIHFDLSPVSPKGEKLFAVGYKYNYNGIACVKSV